MTVFYKGVPYNSVSFNGHYNAQRYRKHYSKKTYTGAPYTTVSYNSMFPKRLPPITVIFNDHYRGLTVITVSS